MVQQPSTSSIIECTDITNQDQLVYKPLLVSPSNGQGVQSEDMVHSLLLVLDWLTGVTPLTGGLQSGIHGDQEPKGKSTYINGIMCKA